MLAMKSLRLEECIEFVFNHVDKTKLLNRKLLEKWLDRQIEPEDLHDLTIDQLLPYYEEKYWNKLHAKTIWHPLDLCLFDFAVRFGLGSAIKVIQQLLHQEPTGVMDPKTLRAIKRIPHHQSFLSHFFRARWDYLKTIRGFEIYQDQWQKDMQILTRFIGLESVIDDLWNEDAS